MSEPLSRCQLAALAGTDEAQIRRLETLGLLASGETGFSSGDVMRVRLVLSLEAAGITPALLAEAVAADALSLDFGASLMHDPVMLSEATVGETLQALRMSEGFARRLWLVDVGRET